MRYGTCKKRWRKKSKQKRLADPDDQIGKTARTKQRLHFAWCNANTSQKSTGRFRLSPGAAADEHEEKRCIPAKLRLRHELAIERRAFWRWYWKQKSRTERKNNNEPKKAARESRYSTLPSAGAATPRSTSIPLFPVFAARSLYFFLRASLRPLRPASKSWDSASSCIRVTETDATRASRDPLLPDQWIFFLNLNKTWTLFPFVSHWFALTGEIRCAALRKRR